MFKVQWKGSPLQVKIIEGEACSAATLISTLIKKYKWIAWAGLLAILLVAIELIYTDIKILFL